MPVPTPTYRSTYVAPPPISLIPLTGQVIAAGTVLGPSLAAKMDNHVDARPQVGLEHADLVFEELVEGGLTRYVAVWQSDVPAEIGPIRSIRPMDPDIVSPLGGIIAYSGGQGVRAGHEGHQRLQRDPRAGRHRDVMFRTNTKKGPAQRAGAGSGADREARRDRGRRRSSSPSRRMRRRRPRCAKGRRRRDDRAAIRAPSTPSWSLDPASGRYLRFQAGAADLDSAGGQLSAANVIVVRVPIGNDGGVPKTC